MNAMGERLSVVPARGGGWGELHFLLQHKLHYPAIRRRQAIGAPRIALLPIIDFGGFVLGRPLIIGCISGPCLAPCKIACSAWHHSPAHSDLM